MATTVNGSGVIASDIGNFLIDASFNGATFAKLFVEDGYAYTSFIDTFSGKSWTDATYNEKSSTSQTLQFSQAASGDKLTESPLIL